MNWTGLALNIPQIVGVAMQAVEQIKGAKGQDKEAAVIATVKSSVPVIEHVANVNISEPQLDTLIANYIQARVALQNLVSRVPQAPAVPEGVIVGQPVGGV